MDLDMRPRLDKTLSLLERANLGFRKLNNQQLGDSYIQNLEPIMKPKINATITTNTLVQDINEMEILSKKMHDFQLKTIKQHHSVCKLTQKSIQDLVKSQFQQLKDMQDVKLKKMLDVKSDPHPDKILDNHANAIDLEIKKKSIELSTPLNEVHTKIDYLSTRVTVIDEKIDNLTIKVSNNAPSIIEMSQKLRQLKSNRKFEIVDDWNPISVNFTIKQPELKKYDHNLNVKLVKQPDFVLLRKTALKNASKEITPVKEKSYYISKESSEEQLVNEKRTFISEISPVSKTQSHTDSISNHDSIDFENPDSPSSSRVKSNQQQYTDLELSEAYQRLLDKTTLDIVDNTTDLKDLTTLSSFKVGQSSSGETSSGKVSRDKTGESERETKANQHSAGQYYNLEATSNLDESSADKNFDESSNIDSKSVNLNSSLLSESKQKELIIGLLGSNTASKIGNSSHRSVVDQKDKSIVNMEATSVIQLIVINTHENYIRFNSKFNNDHDTYIK